ncbi:MAG TPA: hypothetical protein VHG93_03080 [Longimicrobium sp.]|nr:hypothetical protein [Longimicrobium sp.]
MKKIQLRPESLQVQTFAVTPGAPKDRGTVQAHQQSRPFIQCYSQNSCVAPCTNEPTECVQCV